MNAFDFSPLFRHSVGFDRVQRVLDAAARLDSASGGYPPYNIEQVSEDEYRITMAVAGFSEQDLDVTVNDGTLVVSGKTAGEDEEEGATYLHRGIAGRNFQRRFELADHINVVGATLANGLLDVELQREIPEEKKPRKVAIEAAGAKRISANAA